MYKVIIEGFETQAQAEAFISWYEGAGEQDAVFWFQCRKQEGEIDVNFMPVDIEKTYPTEFKNNETKMILRMVDTHDEN